jgi:Uma2 family endonuclease
MSAVTHPATAEQLLRLPQDGFRYELIAGEITKMAPAGGAHDDISTRLTLLLGQHVRKQRLGKTLVCDTGFILARDPDTVRAPDIAFVSRQRLAEVQFGDGFCVGAPDLAVEVTSPHDTLQQVEDKVANWLQAGARLVWVVNPRSRRVSVFRSPTDVRILTAADELSGEDVVPGFACRVAEIFDD